MMMALAGGTRREKHLERRDCAVGGATDQGLDTEPPQFFGLLGLFDP
jgi:hypothetical protein